MLQGLELVYEQLRTKIESIKYQYCEIVYLYCMLYLQ